jgi:hypothetical protein
MFSPVCHAVSNTMTKKSKQSQQPAQKAAKPKVKQVVTSRKTPYTDAGGNAGQSIGGVVGLPGLGKGIGRFLGAGIGSIFGSGDYQVMGPRPSYNVLAGQIPKFSSTAATNIVCHREFLGDISGLAAFTNNTYPLNPGLSQTFPWLSTIAANYQQYRFHGVVFEFRSEITDFVTGGAPGILVMTTNYNADQAAFVSRQEAENAEYAVSTKPTNSLMHMIECAPTETANKLYNVRTTTVPVGQDLRLYDYGLTQIITQNNPVQVLGELWVSYCVEFFKPVLALENAADQAAGLHSYRTSATTAGPLGTLQVTKSGSLTSTITGTTITITNAQVGVVYGVNVYWTAATSVTTFSIAGTTGVVGYAILANDLGAFFTSGNTTATASYNIYFTATATTIVLTAAATIVGSCVVDLFVNSIDPVILT